MIKKSSNLRHSPPEDEDSLKCKETCRRLRREESAENIPQVTRLGCHPGQSTRQQPVGISAGSGIPYPVYSTEEGYISPCSGGAVGVTESQEIQTLPPVSPLLRLDIRHHPTSPPTVMGNDYNSPQTSPSYVCDNMVVGRFMPQYLIESNDGNEISFNKNKLAFVKCDEFQPATLYSSKGVFRTTVQSVPTMHMDMLPSPPNSTNSPAEPAYHNLDSETTKISSSVFNFQDIENLHYSSSEMKDNLKSTLNAQTRNVKHSGMSFSTNYSTENVKSEVENDPLIAFLQDSDSSLFHVKQHLCDTNCLKKQTGNPFAQQDMDFSSDAMQKRADMCTVFMSPQEPTTFSNEQRFNDLSQITIPTIAGKDDVPEAKSPTPSLSRYPLLPRISNSEPRAQEADNASLMSCTSSNHSAQTPSDWYPSFSPSVNDTQSYSSRQSVRSSYSGRGSRNKRALSNSPLSAEGIDLNTLIRMSPTSLFSLATGSRSSSSCVSPGSNGEKSGCYGHLSARNSSSPRSGSTSSVARFSSSQTPKNLVADNSSVDPFNSKNDCFDLDNNLMILQAMQELEASGNFNLHDNLAQGIDNLDSMMIPEYQNLRILPQDMAVYRTDDYLSYLPHYMHTNVYYQTPPPNISEESQKSTNKSLPPLPKKPPPTYDQHMARKATLQKKSSSDSSQPSNSTSSSFESSEGEKTGAGSSSTDTEQNRMHLCQWQDCCMVFQDQDEFVSHIEKTHIDQRKSEEYICLWRTCIRKMPFNARYKLLMHMRVHSGEKPNKCTYTGCKKAFSRLENLKIHIRSHTGERPYSCLYQGCTKTFSNSSDRAKHQKTHQDMRPYVCQVLGCGKRYTDPSSLRKHAKGSHTEKKEPGRKKIRNGIEELDPKDLSECLIIQAINVSPPEPIDSGLGRSPRGSQHGSSTDHYPGFSTSGDTNSRSGSVAHESSAHTSPSSHHSSPRTLNDINESSNPTTVRVPKLPPIVNPVQPKSHASGKQHQNLYRTRPPSLASTSRFAGCSSSVSSSSKYYNSSISLCSMTKDPLLEGNSSFSGYYNLNQGSIKSNQDHLLLSSISRYEKIS